MIEAESQAVLNTLIEQDFQDALRNDRSAANGHIHGRGLLRGWWCPGGPKFFWPDGSTSCGNYGWLFVYNANILMLLPSTAIVV
jgi:hypothetical protein